MTLFWYTFPLCVILLAGLGVGDKVLLEIRVCVVVIAGMDPEVAGCPTGGLQMPGPAESREVPPFDRVSIQSQ